VWVTYIFEYFVTCNGLTEWVWRSFLGCKINIFSLPSVIFVLNLFSLKSTKKKVTQFLLIPSPHCRVHIQCSHPVSDVFAAVHVLVLPRWKTELPLTWVHLEIYMSMEDGPRNRLPLHHPDRIRARDLKLQQRDEERASMNALSRYRCPCNLCGGRRRPYKTSTVARHLRHRGRHGALRGWTEVILFPHHSSSVCLQAARSLLFLT
jgi:hypothetical protein